jgi:hypothetical protein
MNPETKTPVTASAEPADAIRLAQEGETRQKGKTPPDA